MTTFRTEDLSSENEYARGGEVDECTTLLGEQRGNATRYEAVGYCDVSSGKQIDEEAARGSVGDKPGAPAEAAGSIVGVISILLIGMWLLSQISSV